MNPDSAEVGQVSDRTLRRYIADYFQLDMKGGHTTDSRLSANYNIRNFMSLAAVFYAVFYGDAIADTFVDPKELVNSIPPGNVWNMAPTQVVLSDDIMSL